ncbi:MAG: FlgO family outer membrane protein [Pseudomonadota bacterium]
MRTLITLSLLFALILLKGCTLGTMLMAGYKPPQTIADLMREEYNLAGELPPELADENGAGNRKIGIDNYPSNGKPTMQAEHGGSVYSSAANPTLYRPSFTHKGLEDYAAQLMLAMMKNAVGISDEIRIGVSSFVVLDESLQNTTVFGNKLSEYMIVEMQKYGIGVIDHKLKPALTVSTRGDIAFSRDVVQLSSVQQMNHVLSGTLIEKADGTFVSARIMSIGDNRVIASAHLTVPEYIVTKVNGPFMARGY